MDDQEGASFSEDMRIGTCTQSFVEILMNQALTKCKIQLRFNGRKVAYWLFLVLMTIPHLNVGYLNNFPLIDMAINVMKGVTFLVMLFWLLLTRKMISYVIILTAIWRVVLVLSTILHGGQVYNSMASAFSVLSVMLLYEMAYTYKAQTNFLSAQLFCFELIIYINLITEIFWPDGLYTEVSTIVHTKNWFLGYYNGHSAYFIPALMFAWLYWNRTRKLFRPITLTIIIFISAVLSWSGGVLMSLACMTLVFLFFKNRTKIMNYYNYWLLHLVFFFSIKVMHIQDLFIWLLTDVLGKMGSLIFRIRIWDYALQSFMKSPLIGYGLQDLYVRVAELHSPHGVHAHNMLLELLYQGGTIGLILFVLIVIVAGRNIMKHRNTQESKIVSIAFLGWCIATLVEPFTSPFLMGMFVIADHSNQELRTQDSTAAEQYQEKMRKKYRIRMRRR